MRDFLNGSQHLISTFLLVCQLHEEVGTSRPMIIFNLCPFSRLVRALCNAMSSQTPDASCLPNFPPDTCLVLARPQSSGQKEEMALCSLGEKWVAVAVKTQGRERTSIIKEEAHTQPVSLPHPLFFNYMSQLWWELWTITCPAREPSLQARWWVKAASKSLLAPSWSQTLQEGAGSFTGSYWWEGQDTARQLRKQWDTKCGF